MDLATNDMCIHLYNTICCSYRITQHTILPHTIMHHELYTIHHTIHIIHRTLNSPPTHLSRELQGLVQEDGQIVLALLLRGRGAGNQVSMRNIRCNYDDLSSFACVYMYVHGCVYMHVYVQVQICTYEDNLVCIELGLKATSGLH
ncbi:hypothetical protein EON63_05295 [archaeon]|nr:MAG: hypothetical protein EON63_05295 [archaeon]